FPVQWVVRPPESDYRGYAGQLASGMLRRGDEVVALPSGQRSRIGAIDTFDGELEQAVAPLSVTLRLTDDLDISRGEMLCHAQRPPVVARELRAMVVWMSERPLRAGDRLLVKHTTSTVQTVVDELVNQVDVDTQLRSPAPDQLELNDIGEVHLRTARPLVLDPYSQVRGTGALILIDEASNATVGAGMIQAD
ncbi:MAG TPA: sulfate adenylyltransferase, partial [Solirubrobacteraceae bacterium]|nr:sulfate adenylyltransferase [Solirubrobacteraceae bacterium]